MEVRKGRRRNETHMQCLGLGFRNSKRGCLCRGAFGFSEPYPGGQPGGSRHSSGVWGTACGGGEGAD